MGGGGGAERTGRTGGAQRTPARAGPEARGLGMERAQGRQSSGPGAWSGPGAMKSCGRLARARTGARWGHIQCLRGHIQCLRELRAGGWGLGLGLGWGGGGQSGQDAQVVPNVRQLARSWWKGGGRAAQCRASPTKWRYALWALRYAARRSSLRYRDIAISPLMKALVPSRRVPTVGQIDCAKTRWCCNSPRPPPPRKLGPNDCHGRPPNLC